MSELNYYQSRKIDEIMSSNISINSVQNSIQQVVVVDKNTDFAANVVPGRKGKSIKRKDKDRIKLDQDVSKLAQTPNNEHS